MRIRPTSTFSEGGANIFDINLEIGVLAEISARTAKITLREQADTSPGSFLVIESGKYGTFAQVTDVSLQGQSVVAGVKFIATVNAENLDILDGVLHPPRIGSMTYTATSELIRLVSESRQKKDGAGVILNFATLRDMEKTPLSLTPETVFGRHCAVLGTTGSGKSWSLARLVEDAARFHSKTILFDASGEFGTLSGRVIHAYLGKHPKPQKGSQEVVVPYYQLKESDLFAIFKPTGQAQGPKLRAAMKSLKLALLSPQLAVDGTIMKANRTKAHFESEYFKHLTEVEKPECNFDIQHLVKQIQNECVNPYRSATEPHTWGDINGLEQSLCVPLINRIQDIINSPNLAPIFDPKGKPSLLNVIDQFLSHPELRVLCVSLEYLSFAHSAREILANACGRYLLELARGEKFREQPLLVILDEAHQFLNSSLEHSDRDLSLDSFGLIAKEGRKYALNICLATQRPRDIPESVLSQMGTMIVHRLINDSDISVVERAAGGADSFALGSLPVLAPGDAVVLGADFSAPVSISVNKPTNPPFSRGPDFQRLWSGG